MKSLSYLWIGLILLYILPAFIQPEFDKENHIKTVGLAFPRVLSGDEPAYLIATYSLAKDSDLDLRNNYENSFKGSYEGGYNFKNKRIERHVRYIKDNVDFNSIIFHNGLMRDDVKDWDWSVFKQPPFHPSGLPIFASVFLWSLKDFALLESVAIFFSIFISLIGLFCLYRTLLYYKNDQKAAFLITSLIALGTTLWFYSKTFFTEPYITSLLLISYYLLIVRKQIILPALVLGIGMTMKYPFVIFPIIFCFFLLFKKRIKDVFKFGLTTSIFGFCLLFLNYSLYGTIFSQGYGYGNLVRGLLGILLSPTKGILFFSPIFIYTICGIKNFYKSNRNEAILTLSLIVSYYIFFASFHGWWGGGFASRNMIPILPLLGILLYFWYINTKNKAALSIFYILALISIIINFQTAFFHFAFWGDKPPWQLIYLFTNKFLRITTLLGVS